jgi:hypothetical protein
MYTALLGSASKNIGIHPRMSHAAHTHDWNDVLYTLSVGSSGHAAMACTK